MTKTDELREKIADVLLRLFEDDRSDAHCRVVQNGGSQEHARNAGAKAARDSANFYANDILAILPAQPDVSGLVGALEFYSRDGNYVETENPFEGQPGGPIVPPVVLMDRGKRARQALTLSATPESGEAALSIGSALVTIDADGIGYAILRDGKYVPGKVEIQTPEDLKAALTNTEGGE